jgi:hypothetical protein
LSLDVEGQEYAILSTFPFDKYKFNVICLEHNSYCDGEENRLKIKNLLLSKGYSLEIAQSQDDFYIRS